MAVVGLADPCPVYTLLVHPGESRPQPLDTAPLRLMSKVALKNSCPLVQISGGVTMWNPVASSFEAGFGYSNGMRDG